MRASHTHTHVQYRRGMCHKQGAEEKLYSVTCSISCVNSVGLECETHIPNQTPHLASGKHPSAGKCYKMSSRLRETRTQAPADRGSPLCMCPMPFGTLGGQQTRRERRVQRERKEWRLLRNRSPGGALLWTGNSCHYRRRGEGRKGGPEETATASDVRSRKGFTPILR